MAEANIFTFQQPVELLFANLFEQKVPRGIDGAKPRWDITLTMPADHPDFVAIKKLVVAAFQKEYPGVDMGRVEWPFERGEKFIERAIENAATAEKKASARSQNERLLGHVILSAKSYKYAPQLSVLVAGRGVQTFEGENRATVRDKFYSGCLVRAEINFQPWKQPGREERFDRFGVTAYVNAVLSLNKGDRRGGQRSGADRFGGYEHEGTVSATDPRAMADADIAF